MLVCTSLSLIAYVSVRDTSEFPTVAITWPQGVLGEEDESTAAAQVHGSVS